MKNKGILFIVVGFLCFCFVVFYKGLNNPNTYIPETNKKKISPFLMLKTFIQKTTLLQIKFLKKTFFIL